MEAGNVPPPGAAQRAPHDSRPHVNDQWHQLPRQGCRFSQSNFSNMTAGSFAHRHPLCRVSASVAWQMVGGLTDVKFVSKYVRIILFSIGNDRLTP